MLILTRYLSQSIIIGDDVNIKILSVKDNHVRLGIEAPKNISVHREEIYLKIQAAKEKSNKKLANHEK